MFLPTNDAHRPSHHRQKVNIGSLTKLPFPLASSCHLTSHRRHAQERAEERRRTPEEFGRHANASRYRIQMMRFTKIKTIIPELIIYAMRAHPLIAVRLLWSPPLGCFRGLTVLAVSSSLPSQVGLRPGVGVAWRLVRSLALRLARPPAPPSVCGSHLVARLSCPGHGRADQSDSSFDRSQPARRSVVAAPSLLGRQSTGVTLVLEQLRSPTPNGDRGLNLSLTRAKAGQPEGWTQLNVATRVDSPPERAGAILERNAKASPSPHTHMR